MPGVIKVDQMSKAERERLLEAISGNGGNGRQQAPTPAADNAEQEGEGEWEYYIPWYVRPMQVGVYVFAYLMLGAGWLVTHLGVGLTWLGHEAKNAVRNID